MNEDRRAAPTVTTREIGVLGLGEAGFALASSLSSDRYLVRGYDVRLNDLSLRARVTAAGITIADTVGALADSSGILLILTTAVSAEPVIASLAPFLRDGQIVGDFNSASPRLKTQLGEKVEAAGATFVDGAIMGPATVPPVPVVLSGRAAAELADALAGTGFEFDVIGTEPGQAATEKMMRSLIVKGLEALFLELTLALDDPIEADRVLASLDRTLPMTSWRDLATYLGRRTRVHGARRAGELREVAQTLADSGVEPLIAAAAAERMARAAEVFNAA